MNINEQEKEEYSQLLNEWKTYQLDQRKDEYSIKKYINFMLITFNINEKIISNESIEHLFQTDKLETIDFIAINIQEIDMSVSGFLKGNTVISKSKELSENIMNSINSIFPNQFIQLTLLQLGGVVLILYCKESLKQNMSMISTGYEAVGAMGMANKGGIAFSFKLFDTSICIIGSHLAAHQQEILKRTKNFTDIFNNIVLNPLDHLNEEIQNDQNETNGNLQKIEQHHIILWLGDLNYRIDEEDSIIRERIQYNSAIGLIETNDQLSNQRKKNELLKSFKEFEIKFNPTYKFITNTDDYSEKRKPAYCDRILYRQNRKLDIKCHEYISLTTIKESDHKPVRGIFEIETQRNIKEKYDSIIQELLKKENELTKIIKPSIEINKNEFEIEIYPFEKYETSMNIKNNGNAKIKIDFNTFDYANKMIENETTLLTDGIQFHTLPKWLTISPNKIEIDKNDYETKQITFKFHFNFISTQHLFDNNNEFKYTLIMKVRGRNDIFLSFHFKLKPTSINKTIQDMNLHPNGYTKVQPIAYCPLVIPKEIWRLCEYMLPFINDENILKEFMPSDSHLLDYFNILSDLDHHRNFQYEYKYHRMLELLYLYLINLKESIIPSKLLQSMIGAANESDEEIEKFFYTFKSIIPVCHYNLFVYLISFLQEIIQSNPSININNALIRFFIPCFININNIKLSQKEYQQIEYFLMYYVNKIN